MRRMTKTFGVLIGAALVIAACDSADRVMSSAGPQSAVFASRTVTYTGEQIIGTAGGTVTVRGARDMVLAELVVPAGAVTKDARFVLQVASDGRVAVSATSIGSRRINDIGAGGFLKPVRLYVSKALGNGTSSVNGASVSTSSTIESDLSFRTAAAGDGSGGDGEPCDTTGGPPGPCWVWVEMEGFSGYVPISD